MRTVGILSGKGGVGKTTVVANLSAALANLGFDVTAIDMNVTTPNLGFYLGYHLAEISLHDILKNVERLKNGIYIHPSGVKVIPGSLSVEDVIGVDISNITKIISNLKSDFVILDSAAGLGREALASISSSDDILIVTNPEITSLADSLRAIKVAENLGKNVVGIVLNRTGRSRNEISVEEIERMFGYPVLVKIPEDRWVLKSLELKVPLVYLNPNSKASIEFQNLAYAIIGSSYRRKQSFIDRLLSWVK